jgi:Ras-related protein Rab-1A
LPAASILRSDVQRELRLDDRRRLQDQNDGSQRPASQTPDLDTAGKERFQSITANYYHGSHAIAIVYDITNRQSFENLRRWVADVDRLGSPQVSRIIIGNKADLEDKRQVRRDEGDAFAGNLGVPFMETSAKTSFNVREMFNQLCLAISERHGIKLGPGFDEGDDGGGRTPRPARPRGALCRC